MTLQDVDNFIKAAINEVDQLSKRRQALTTEIGNLSLERDRVNEQIDALKNFIRASTSTDQPSVDTNQDAVMRNGHMGPDDEDAPNLHGQKDAAYIAVEILREAGGKDMHYVELAKQVKARGGNLPEHQRSSTATLNRILNSDPRFIRPFRRGYYALKEHFPNVNRSIGKRLNKRTRANHN